MKKYAYPARFSRVMDGVTVTFPGLPEAITCGSDLGDAIAEAADCLQEAIAGRMVRREAIPIPSEVKRGQRLVSVALYLAPKLAVYFAMREQGVSNSELARRLGVTEIIVRRMLTPKHHTRPEKIEAALAALGKRITIVEEAA